MAEDPTTASGFCRKNGPQRVCGADQDTERGCLACVSNFGPDDIGAGAKLLFWKRLAPGDCDRLRRLRQSLPFRTKSDRVSGSVEKLSQDSSEVGRIIAGGQGKAS
ncbi:MAG: hypothetical protein JWL77_6779 [Chthonomonadaceae bacterium]|nr:hypothetical protein [Chthonomonadaceae bacterium]